MKEKVVLVVLAVLSIGLLFGVSQAIAASGDVVWKNTFDGGQIVVGEDKENQSVWIIKTDKNGTEQVDWIFNGTGGDYDYGEPTCQTLDGGHIAIDNVKKLSFGPHSVVHPCDIRLTKTDVNGTEQWNKTFGKTLGGIPEDAYKFGESILQTSDGGYIVVGYRIDWDCGSHLADVLLIKTDANGKEQWDKTLTTDIGNYSSYGRLILQTSDGGYIVAVEGTEGGFYFDAPDKLWLIKISANGTEEWKKRFGRLKSPTPKPILTPAPTPTPTPETPGFEAIFAIAGLLAIAYLVRQRE